LRFPFWPSFEYLAAGHDDGSSLATRLKAGREGGTGQVQESVTEIALAGVTLLLLAGNYKCNNNGWLQNILFSCYCLETGSTETQTELHAE